jgi:plastocyanin
MKKLVFAALPLVVVLAACGGDDDDDAAPAEDGVVRVVDNEFQPEELEIEVGDTVTWRFEGAQAHNVTFSSEDHSDLMKDGTYEKTFDEAGTFDYTCTVHAGMNGTIEVVESAGAAP